MTSESYLYSSDLDTNIKMAGKYIAFIPHKSVNKRLICFLEKLYKLLKYWHSGNNFARQNIR